LRPQSVRFVGFIAFHLSFPPRHSPSPLTQKEWVRVKEMVEVVVPPPKTLKNSENLLK